nr:hypothetical protein [Hassalia byssoidea]
MAIVASEIAFAVSKAILATREIANGFGEIAIVVSKMAIVA